MARRTRKNPALTALDAASVYAPNTTISKRAAQAAKVVSAAALVPMAAPPTITIPASGTAWGTAPITSDSVLTGPLHIAYDNADKFRYLGGALSGAGTGATFGYNTYMFASNFIKSTMRISWYTDAPDFEFMVRHTDTGGAYRLICDGQWAGPAVTVTGDGLRRSVRVQSSTRKLRLWQLEIDSMAFGGINVTIADTVAKGPPPTVRSVFFGDSYAQGVGATRPGEGLAYQVANQLGWEDAYTCGQTGTGYLRATATTGFTKFIDRIPTHLTPLAPATIVIFGGLNDNTFNDPAFTPEALGVAATAFYAALYAALPLAEVFVVGPLASSGSNTTLNKQKNALVKAAALAQPNVKVFMDSSTDADPWVTGNGKVGTPTGTGNADVLIATDGAHPSPTGHDVLAARISSAIKSYYFGLAA
jgi:lysophospholipase L1-like esterase